MRYDRTIASIRIIDAISANIILIDDSVNKVTYRINGGKVHCVKIYKNTIGLLYFVDPYWGRLYLDKAVCVK